MRADTMRPSASMRTRGMNPADCWLPADDQRLILLAGLLSGPAKPRLMQRARSHSPFQAAQ